MKVVFTTTAAFAMLCAMTVFPPPRAISEPVIGSKSDRGVLRTHGMPRRSALVIPISTVAPPASVPHGSSTYNVDNTYGGYIGSGTATIYVGQTTTSGTVNDASAEASFN